MVSLKPFSVDATVEKLRLDAEMIWTGSLMELRFLLTGDIAGIKGLVSHRTEAWPSPTEGLWNTTCFEAFFGAKDSSEYFEINAAPDGRWMVFQFEKVREGRSVRADLRPTEFRADLRPARFELLLRFDFADVSELADRSLAATPAVVLDNGGSCSYWSLKHSSKPDFHNPAHRILELNPA